MGRNFRPGSPHSSRVGALNSWFGHEVHLRAMTGDTGLRADDVYALTTTVNIVAQRRTNSRGSWHSIR
jgi:hypothetical protein